MSTGTSFTPFLTSIACLAFLAHASALRAQGFDVGGLIGGLGGLAQGAMQADLARQRLELERRQLELEQRRLRNEEWQRRQAPIPASVPEPAPAAPSSSLAGGPVAYEADGLRLDRVLDPQTLPDGFKCVGSHKFPGLLSCSNKDGDSGTAIYLNGSSVVAYYGRYLENIKITRTGVNGHLRKFSAAFNSMPRIVAQDVNSDGSYAILATWGAIAMTRMSDQADEAIKAGQGDIPGIYVEYHSGVDASAKGGKAIYHVEGGPGFYMIAFIDRTGRGRLRYGAYSASSFGTPWSSVAAIDRAPQVPPPAPVATATPIARLQPQPIVAVRPTVETPASGGTTPPSRPTPPSNAAEASPVAQTLLPATGAATTTAMPVLPDQGRRVALVIGNGAYQSVARLDNPNGDAEAVAGVLRAVGFASVRLVEDVTLTQMKEALRDFQAQADDADWALVYYAGHGIEISGQNYLIPVDAHLRSDQDADDEAVTLRYLLDKMHNARRLRMVILDACRENPFQGVMKRQIAARGVTRGLAPYEPRVANEMVVYAAKDGEQAQDGSNAGHSPFAKALVARLPTPGIEINKLFRLVTADVLVATSNQQQPFVYGSTPGEDDFYFRPR